MVGAVSLHTYESNGKHGASLEVLADDVEFLSPRVSDTPAETQDAKTGYTVIDDPDGLPF